MRVNATMSYLFKLFIDINNKLWECISAIIQIEATSLLLTACRIPVVCFSIYHNVKSIHQSCLPNTTKILQLLQHKGSRQVVWCDGVLNAAWASVTQRHSLMCKGDGNRGARHKR